MAESIRASDRLRTSRITSSEKLREPWLGDHNRGIRANH
jgi:hypothetical protein